MNQTGTADDAELLERYARDADQTAFEELVRRHLGLVYSAALRREVGRRCRPGC